MQFQALDSDEIIIDYHAVKVSTVANQFTAFL